MSAKPPARRPPVWTPFFRRFTDERATDLRDTQRLQREVHATWKTSRWSQADAVSKLLSAVIEHLDKHPRMPKSGKLREEIHEALAGIIALENAIVRSSDFDWNNAHLSLQEQVNLRRFLRAQQHFLANEQRVLDLFFPAVIDIFTPILDALPQSSNGSVSSLTVPLHDLLTDLPDVIAYIFGAVTGAELENAGLFAELTDKLGRNVCTFSGIPFEDAGKKKPIPPSKADLSPAKLVATYLGGTSLHALLATQAPFAIPRKAFSEHGALFAKSGHGKTQTLRTMVAGFLQEDDPPALFIMDSLGSLIEGVDRLDVFATRLKDRLVIIDPSDPVPPALNFFKVQSDDLVFYLFKAIDQSFTQRQATMISYLMELVRNIHGATLITLIEVCESKQNLYPDVVKNLSPFARSFFENQFYAKKPDQLVQQTKSQIANRIYTLGRLPKFQQMFSAPENAFDPFRCMQEKAIVLINTDARPSRLGGLGDASSILGRFILAQCLDAARARPKNERHLALLIVDEAKAYMDEQAALILSDARQFGLGLLLATQFPHQLEDGVRKEINTNTSIKMMGPVEYAVAAQYARDMFTTPEFIMGTKSYDRSHAEWATYVANVTGNALKLSVPFGAIEKLPCMDEPTHKALRTANMLRYGTSAPTEAKREHPAVSTPAEPDKETPTDNGDDAPLIEPGKQW